MRNLDETGADPVFPKFFKCLNCGCETLVESYDDMERNLPNFGWLPFPNAPGSMQFGCPNNCGACYVSACTDCRQKFHYADSISYGGDDVTHVKFGERSVTEVVPNQRKYRFTHKRPPKRRKGDEEDGTIPTPR